MRLASVHLTDGRPAIVALAGRRHLLVRADAELDSDMDLTVLERDLASASTEVSRAELTFRPVVPHPRRVVCLGLNYHAHVEETGRDLPTYPVFFTKWASTLAGSGADIVLPPESAQVDWEAELAVVIGRGGRRIPAGRALEHVAGVTAANDLSMRDYQYRSHQWLQGKAWDATTPLGPYLVTLDELSDVHALAIRLTVNGEERQNSNTARLIFDIPTIVQTLSEFTQLDPGDVILTGTPGGVGARRDPPVFLAPGDTVTVTIDEVGELTNRLVAASAGVRRSARHARL